MPPKATRMPDGESEQPLTWLYVVHGRIGDTTQHTPNRGGGLPPPWLNPPTHRTRSALRPLQRVAGNVGYCCVGAGG